MKAPLSCRCDLFKAYLERVTEEFLRFGEIISAPNALLLFPTRPAARSTMVFSASDRYTTSFNGFEDLALRRPTCGSFGMEFNLINCRVPQNNKTLHSVNASDSQ